MLRRFMLLLLLLLLPPAWGATDDVLVDKAWLRESVPGQDSVSLQLNLTALKAATLIEVSSPRAEAIKIQRLTRRQGSVKANTIENLRLVPRRALAFGSANYALMMVGLKQPLNVGDRVPVSLTVQFANKQTKKITVEAEVHPLELSYKHYNEREVYDRR